MLTMKEMTKIAATSVGRKPGVILFIPATVIRLLAPVVERIGRVPRGAISGLVGDGPQQDMIGNPAPLRMLIGRSDRPFRQAIEGQVL